MRKRKTEWDKLDAIAKKELVERLNALGWDLTLGGNFQWAAVRRKPGRDGAVVEQSMNPYRLLKAVEDRER